MDVKDRQKPGVDALMAMADGLGVSADWLAGWSDGPEDHGIATEDDVVFCGFAA